MKLKTSRFWATLAIGGLLVIAHASTAQAQMINPFGVNKSASLTKEDYKLGQVAVGKLLSDPPAVDRNETWNNPVTGNHGTLTILKIFTSKDMPCRTVQSQFDYKKLGSASRTVKLDVCKLPTGEWKIVS